jgi:CRP-like cAMP-binding protein
MIKKTLRPATAAKLKTESFEEAADSIISRNMENTRIYTEKALARKIRLEQKHMLDFDDTALPESAAHYILKSHIRLTVSSAGLTKFQSAVTTLAMMGWSPRDIADHFELPYHKIIRALRIAQRKIKHGTSPYHGLWEVYWSEVRRRGYRKPRGRIS